MRVPAELHQFACMHCGAPAEFEAKITRPIKLAGASRASIVELVFLCRESLLERIETEPEIGVRRVG